MVICDILILRIFEEEEKAYCFYHFATNFSMNDGNNGNAYGYAEFFYKKVSNIQPGIYAKSWIFSDRQSTQTSRFSNHSLGLKTNYKPKKEM